MNSPFLGRYLAKPSHWRTGPSLVSARPQTHSNTNKLAHKVPLSGWAGRFEFERIQLSVFLLSLDALRLTLGAEWCGEDRNIQQEKRNQCSVGVSLNKPFHQFQMSCPPSLTEAWGIYITLKFISSFTHFSPTSPFLGFLSFFWGQHMMPV